MTFLEVLDDAVKIGLGAFGGWLIARGSRSHDFERERRRRKQDCLERVMEDLDDAEAAISAFCVASLGLRAANIGQFTAWRTGKRKQAMQLSWAKDMLEQSNKCDGTLTKLNRSHNKLIVFGFTECAKSLHTYSTAAIGLKMVLNDVRDDKKPLEDYASERQKLAKLSENFCVVITKAFATL